MSKIQRERIDDQGDRFPRLWKLDVQVYLHQSGIWYVERKDLQNKLKDKWNRFCDLFGVQTQFVEGPYAHDVEAVLERMASGKLTGSQLDWD